MGCFHNHPWITFQLDQNQTKKVSKGGSENPTGLLSQSLTKKQEKETQTRAFQPLGARHPWAAMTVNSFPHVTFNVC